MAKKLSQELLFKEVDGISVEIITKDIRFNIKTRDWSDFLREVVKTEML